MTKMAMDYLHLLTCKNVLCFDQFGWLWWAGLCVECSIHLGCFQAVGIHHLAPVSTTIRVSGHYYELGAPAIILHPLVMRQRN